MKVTSDGVLQVTYDIDDVDEKVIAYENVVVTDDVMADEGEGMEIADALGRETYGEKEMGIYDASEVKIFALHKVISALKQEPEVNDADEVKQNILAEIGASCPENANALED
ncbi:unnamed protein product [Spirodela intermedia]|uniref:Uncharacterized protein n=1 Tax=Spirodela intermedia TaxID=51605 RepID=A0A7I8K5B3_SPIIN|nr:unnamed protein product [Spirodela intermedia]